MIRPDNPCFGCTAHRGGQEIHAPCCYDSVLLVDSEEYKRLFLQRYLAGEVDVEERLKDGQMYFYIYLLGKCPFLDDDGLCSTEATKPKGCRAAMPGEFRFCVR